MWLSTIPPKNDLYTLVITISGYPRNWQVHLLAHQDPTYWQTLSWTSTCCRCLISKVSLNSTQWISRTEGRAVLLSLLSCTVMMKSMSERRGSECTRTYSTRPPRRQIPMHVSWIHRCMFSWHKHEVMDNLRSYYIKLLFFPAYHHTRMHHLISAQHL